MASAYGVIRNSENQFCGKRETAFLAQFMPK